MKSDVQIASETVMEPIAQVAEKLGIDEDFLEYCGRHKAKLSRRLLSTLEGNKDGKLILVTAINPTPAGEGKTTTTIGLSQALWKLNKKAVAVLREPSLGPCMGMKGGATGGGYSQVLPMAEINLHFTGDMHAITSCHNLLSALIDNHVYHGNKLKIDITRILWPRVMDINDRGLRKIIVGLDGLDHIIPRRDGFMITVASEVMAILCLSKNITDLKEKLSKIIAAYDMDGNPITAKDLQAVGAMAALLYDAIKPNLVQTIEHTPAIIHGGPFANIAHGCNSIRATKLGIKLADIVVTEAGFGADLGAEKFFDIKCRLANLKPDAVVLVATIRALKYNGGVKKDNLKEENLEALKIGFANLERHIQNIGKFGMPLVVALNTFETDTQAEIDLLTRECEKLGVEVSLSEVWKKGGEGGVDLAKKVIKILETKPSQFKFLYDVNDTIENKINTIALEIYGAKTVVYAPRAKEQMKKIEEMGYANIPICIAKTPYSFSDNPNLLGCPKDFEINIRSLKLSAGAGFIVAYAGDIMTMPGLPSRPAAFDIDIGEDNKVVGIF